MKAHNKIFVVTGAGGGIGRELVLQLLSKGAKVMAADINEASLLETTEQAGEKKASLRTFKIDLTNRHAVQVLYEKTLEYFGAIDGIINNAGIIQPFIKVNELEMDLVERVMNVNFYGTVYMTKTFLPHLLSRPEAHIVNVSSMGGFLPVPGQTIYGAAKAAVKLFTEGLHSELLDTNVHVTVVFPGAIATNIVINSGVERKRTAPAKGSSIKPLPPGEAAKIIIRGMEQNSSRILVGKDAKFLDTLYRFNPRYAAKFIAGKMKEILS